VHTRFAFEKLIRTHCEKKNLVSKSRLKEYTTEDFWQVIKDDLPGQIQNDIETCRPLVLNESINYNPERHEIRAELTKAILAIKDLKDQLANL